VATLVFEKNEIITLKDGIKHIVVDILEYENKYYYYLAEVDNDETTVKNKFSIVTTVSENGNTFIKTIKGDLLEELTTIFNEKLEITK
jgi:hypothetical protein